MSTLPPLAAIRAFEAAARHENYSRAAEELGLTQAGVSYQIKLLEERLGTQLFARRGRGMMLTDAGRRLAPRVTEAFTTLSKAFATAQADNEAVLAITSSRTFATNWLAGRLGAFNLVRPNLAVRLHVSDDVVDLASSEFDVAVRGVPAPTPGLINHFVMWQVVTPMASPDFLSRHPVATPADLLTVPRLSPTDEWWDLWFGSLADFGYAGAEQTGIRFDSQVLDGHAALAGHGVAVLAPAMFTQAIEAGQLTQIFPDMATDHRGFWLVYPEHKRRLAKVRAFHEWLLKTVRDEAGEDPHGMLVAPPFADTH